MLILHLVVAMCMCMHLLSIVLCHLMHTQPNLMLYSYQQFEFVASKFGYATPTLLLYYIPNVLLGGGIATLDEHGKGSSLIRLTVWDGITQCQSMMPVHEDVLIQ